MEQDRYIVPALRRGLGYRPGEASRGKGRSAA